MKTTKRRTMRDLKTQAGMGGTAAKPTSRHAVALQLAMLEIERSRREKESEAAEKHANGVKARLCEIDAECRRLKAQLGESLPDGPKEPQGATTKESKRKLRF